MIARIAYCILAIVMCVFETRVIAQERTAFAGYVGFGVVQLAAAQTFDAVSGSSRASIVSGGAHISKLWRGIFVDVGLGDIAKNGERVSLSGSDIVPLGVPLTVRMRYLDVAAGWRHAFGRMSLYAGAGLTRVKYVESDSSEPVDLEVAAKGPLLLTGVDMSVGRWVRVGAELRGRRVGGILGATGASAHFGESSAGGISTTLRLSVGR